jgi:sodium-dependent phosphate cotransporter
VTSRTKAVGILKVAGFALALNVFFVAIHLLGAFKDVGSGMGEQLMAELATRPLVGLLLGLLVTSLIQSSSTTTSLVVGLAAAGVFGESPERAMAAAVPIIMGANIGTTVTNTIVSFGSVGSDAEFKRAFAAATVHDIFNFLTVLILLPLQAATNFLGIASLRLTALLDQAGGLRLASPLKWLVDPQIDAMEALFDNQAAVDFVVLGVLIGVATLAMKLLMIWQHQGKPSGVPLLGSVLALAALGTVVKTWHELVFSKPMGLFLLGLALLLGALWAIVAIMRTVVVERARRIFGEYVFATPLRALAVGLLFTALVQSSSVTTSLIVPLAGAGLVTLPQVFPYTLGANLGTTITALLAALSLGEPLALAVALAHVLFNVIGTLLFFPVERMRRLPLWLAMRLAEGAIRWKLLPAVWVLGLYVLIPLFLIWLSSGAG